MGWVKTILDQLTGNEEAVNLYHRAKTHVETRTAIFAEYHQQPYARAVLCDLIDQQCVNCVSLEIAPNISMESYGKAKDKTVDKNLEELAALADLTDKEGLKAIFEGKFPKELRGTIANYGQNAISFEVIMKRAIVNRVRIVFHDVKGNDKSATVAERDIASAEYLKKTLNPFPAARLVLLVGSSHTKLSSTSSLQSVCGLQDSDVFNFSTFGIPKLEQKDIKKGSELEGYRKLRGNT